MVLVDTTVWIHHFIRGDQELTRLLYDGLVMVHPSIIGEISCTDMKNRREILHLLAGLPQCKTASPDECFFLVENSEIRETGVGWADVELIASARVSQISLYTKDRILRRGWQAVA